MGEFSSAALIDGLEAAIGSDCFAILCDGLTSDPTLLQAISAELIAGDNYSRKGFIPGSATYDEVQNRAELPAVSLSWTVDPSGSAISFDTIAIVGGTTSFANIEITGLDGVSNRFLITSNPFVDGDKVIVTAPVGGTAPPAVSALILTVDNADSSGFQLLDDSNAVVPVSGGVLPLVARNANGTIRYVEPLGSSQILPGNTKTYTLYLNHGESTANVTAA